MASDATLSASLARLRAQLARLRAQRPRGLLFLCVANSMRSQMAEGIARALAPEGVEIFSAGSQASCVHPLAIRVMDEIGIDIRDQWSKAVEEIDVDGVDAVVTLCAGEICPLAGSDLLHEQWPLPDPISAAAEPLDGCRAVRDELRRRITELFR